MWPKLFVEVGGTTKEGKQEAACLPGGQGATRAAVLEPPKSSETQ